MLTRTKYLQAFTQAHRTHLNIGRRVLQVRNNCILLLAVYWVSKIVVTHHMSKMWHMQYVWQWMRHTVDRCRIIKLLETVYGESDKALLAAP